MKNAEVAERLGTFREVLGSIAEGGPSTPQATEYKEIRERLTLDERVSQMLPDFIIECRTARDFWNYIQRVSSERGAYGERSRYIEAQLLPIERQFRPERQRAPGDRPPEIRIEYAPGSPASNELAFISDIHLSELRTLNSPQFDFGKLTRLCQELNVVYSRGCYFATLMLTRSLLDHVPPLFGQETFCEVANNYGDGGKSLKKTLQRLQITARTIADALIHTKIRKVEVLPVIQQANFSAELNVLLGEIIRIHSQRVGTHLGVDNKSAMKYGESGRTRE